jgi:hypothetical protein
MATLFVEVALGIRIVMKLVAVDPGSYLARFRYDVNPAVAEFIYTATDPLLLPFSGISADASAERFVLEIPTLVAMVAYGLLGWLIGRIILRIFENRRKTRLGDS